jgi:hypothetical protein
MSTSQEEAVTKLAGALAVLLHPDDTDVETFEQVISATVTAQQTLQAATAQAVGATANCRIIGVSGRCTPATQQLAPPTQELAPGTQDAALAARRGPIRWGAAAPSPSATAPSPSSTSAPVPEVPGRRGASSRSKDEYVAGATRASAGIGRAVGDRRNGAGSSPSAD